MEKRITRITAALAAAAPVSYTHLLGADFQCCGKIGLLFLQFIPQRRCFTQHQLTAVSYTHLTWRFLSRCC